MALTTDLQQQVYDLLARSSNISFVSAEPESGGLGIQALSLAPGQRVTAEVLAMAQGNRVPVRIGNQQLNLELALPVRPGQNLELTFVSDGPRPTFAMARPGVASPPVSLTDASRLLSLLVTNDQLVDPRVRSSLQSIGDLLRRSSGDANVLANFLDDFLTYRADGRSVVGPGVLPDKPEKQVGGDGQPPPQTSTNFGGRPATVFEDTASKLLLNLAQRARFTLVEVTNQLQTPLPLKPGDEVNALVQGSLPGGRVFAQLAGETLEFQLSRPVQQGEILRLALVAQQPRIVFALLGRPAPDQGAMVSDTARWLSALVQHEEGQGEIQQNVLNRLQQAVSSLPPGSPALAAIMDEAMTYAAAPWLSSRLLPNTPSSAAPRAQGKVDDEVLKLLQSLVQGSRLALLEPELPPEQRALPFAPGQQLKGEVLQSLGGGRFMIQVAGQNLEVVLPKGIRPGDTLNLFAIESDTPALLLVRQGKGGSSATVSDTGRWVSTQLAMQNQAAPLKEGLGILKTLLSSSPSDAALLEQRLARGMQESGLFYESHLTRWFSGEYPLEGLLKEPQGRLSANQQPPQPQTSTHIPGKELPQESAASATRSGLPEPDDAATDVRSLPAQRASLQSPAMLNQVPGKELLQDSSVHTSRSGTQSVPDGGADARTLPIIREQLATLQTNHLLFHGELFPGQPMEWRIEEREGRGGQEQPEHERRSWETSLSLTLPTLGSIDAALTLDGNKVSARIVTGRTKTAQLLDEGRSELMEQLSAAGLEAESIEVRHGERTPQD